MFRVRSTLTIVVLLSLSTMLCASGVVPLGVTKLADNGTESNPANWWLDRNYITSDEMFTVGVYDGAPGSWNNLDISSEYSFTASKDLKVGGYRSGRNSLNIHSGGHVDVDGTFYSGQGSIAYYSTYNSTTVSGTGSLLSVTGSLDLNSGYNATDNKITISDGGQVVIDSDKDGTGNLDLYNHWAYGNCWMELDGGSLFIWGDKRGDFVDGKGILTSIKVWSEATDDFEPVAFYNGQVWTPTQYLDLLEVDYIQDAAQAASLGLSSDMVGFTVIQNVPEPGILAIICVGAIGVIRKRSV